MGESCKFMTGGKCRFGSTGMNCDGGEKAMSNCPLWVEEPKGNEECAFGFGNQCHFARGRVTCDGKKPLDYCPVWNPARTRLSKLLRR